MAKTLNKSGKKLVKKKGKDGRVRAYWMGQKDTPKRMRQGAAPEKQGFLQKHGGKLAAGAALLGVAALNRHGIAGAVDGAKRAHNVIQGSGLKVGMGDRAASMFRLAKVGFMARHHRDGSAKLIGAARGLPGALSGYRANAGQHVKNWRQGIGSQLAGHMTETLGGAAAEHLGSRFGSVAGTAVGSMFGPAGAALGGFVGGHAGGFLGGRHAAPHIQKAARWAAQRMAQR